MIAWFDEITAADTALVGGKGAKLGECARAGMPVPPGFCVCTDAYRVATSGVSSVLAEAAARGDAVAARELVLSLPLPEAVEAAITKAYERLGGVPVAVRSSATAEDLAEASFAGQQDTYLGIVGAEDVVDAVRRCWASLWTDRAVDYRRQQGVADDGLSLAVVVQAMIPADTAGVLFTHNPVTGDDAVMLASSSYGLGESVVAALVTPDTFTLSRNPTCVISVEVGSKETRIDMTGDGDTITTEVSKNARSRQSLTEGQLLRLVDLGEQVEAHYGHGQDIEWAFADDELYLLQARPITTNAGTVVGHARVKGRLERALRDDLIEHFPSPFPLDLYAVHQVQDVIQNLMNTAGLKTVPASSLIQGDDDGIIRIHITKPRPTWTMVTRLPILLRKGMRHDPATWPREEAALCHRLAELRIRADDLNPAEDRDVLDLVRDSVEQAATITRDRFIQYNAPMIVGRMSVARMLKSVRMERELSPEDLYAGVPYKTAQITAGINGLAAAARHSNVAGLVIGAPQGCVADALAVTTEGQEFQELVDKFLAENGARTARLYLPFSNRSWREDPEAFYALLAATLRGAPMQQITSTDVVTEVENCLPTRLRKRWRKSVAALRARHIGREGTVYMIEEFFCIARAGTDEIARRLVDRGQLDSLDDIRFLYFHEIEEAAGDTKQRLQEKVVWRRRRRGTAEALWWDRGDITLGASALKGLPASAGRATGTARVIHSPDEFHRLQPGDILVCPYTDPTWTPLFALAAAVVADSGGPLSHAAIVAREYGIPAVLGTGNATGLPDGTRLLVDGSAGTVTIMGDDQP